MALTTSIKERRRELGMSQAELAKAVGCRRETIGNLEIGRYNPSLKLAYDISVVLGASIYDLFHFEDEQNDKPDSNTER